MLDEWWRVHGVAVLGDVEDILDDVEALRDATVLATRPITYLTHITQSIVLTDQYALNI